MTGTVGVPRETFPGERRVALTPRACDALNKAKLGAIVEYSAGLEAGFPDDEYARRGVRLGTRAEVFAEADIIVQARAAGANPERGLADIPLLRPGQILIGFGDPLTSPRECLDLAEAGVSFFAMELVPRITRAQGMDALSSMASIAGYEAVLLGATALPKMFPMMMTAAGTITPAKVLVLGAGVAGLQAIATARRLGAVVSAYDLRAAVKEQIESLGAKFVVLDIETGGAEDKGGYAKAMDEAFYKRQRELLTEVLKEQDVVITTAAVPGRKAPILITAEMAEAMAPGSVIVDIAAERGGNCELTRLDETIVHRGVTILGPGNLPSRAPYHASQMYATNVVNLIKLLLKDGAVQINPDDEIIRETLVTHQGKVVHPRVGGMVQQEVTRS
ncbi:MAG TPA: Re/Si-specific NAD(P)(+) transhydrogenase subunit alpha [Bryobacteraceae bacterium]|nr:Re/Si-specific NAD(P)(+) transhydrogenase subunit alpha [Bryobacteraceae bacterium]